MVTISRCDGMSWKDRHSFTITAIMCCDQINVAAGRLLSGGLSQSVDILTLSIPNLLNSLWIYV